MYRKVTATDIKVAKEILNFYGVSKENLDEVLLSIGFTLLNTDLESLIYGETDLIEGFMDVTSENHKRTKQVLEDNGVPHKHVQGCFEEIAERLADIVFVGSGGLL